MASVNRVILIGNLGKDPEMRYLPSGEASATLALATTETWKDKQGAKQEKTDWHRVEFIGRTAEVCGEYLKKGSSVYVEGRISYDSWDDKATGEKKYMTRIRGDRMQMMGTKPGGGSGGDASFDNGGESGGGGGGGGRAPAPARQAPSGAPAAKKPAKMDDFDDDIPF